MGLLYLTGALLHLFLDLPVACQTYLDRADAFLQPLEDHEEGGNEEQ